MWKSEFFAWNLILGNWRFFCTEKLHHVTNDTFFWIRDTNRQSNKRPCLKSRKCAKLQGHVFANWLGNEWIYWLDGYIRQVSRTCTAHKYYSKFTNSLADTDFLYHCHTYNLWDSEKILYGWIDCDESGGWLSCHKSDQTIEYTF